MALVTPHVGLHVHGQGRHRSVELVAHAAAPPFVSVDLTMAGEVTAGGKHLTTVVTRLELLTSGHSETNLEAVAGVLGAVREALVAYIQQWLGSSSLRYSSWKLFMVR